MEIQFIPVKDNQTKMRKVCEVVAIHYRAGDRVLITVENQEVSQYVDQLLWRYPLDSFLPHQVTLKPSLGRIVITTAKENLNKASVLFNLCPKMCSFYQQFQKVYELDDETHPEKKRLSEERKKSYKLTLRKDTLT